VGPRLDGHRQRHSWQHHKGKAFIFVNGQHAGNIRQNSAST
jgi:hypothetical protein